MSITINVKGFKEVEKLFKEFGEDAEKEIELETEAAAINIETDARKLAPVDRGGLQGGMFSRKEEDKKGLIVYSAGNSLDYAAYVEFGTGAKVSVPSELQDVASQFKSGRGGSFADALKNIKGWVKRKGLSESSAYPILMSILRKGLTPQPFLYPAFVINRNEFIQDMKNALIRLTKKLT